MQGVEVVRLSGENVPIKRFGFVQLPALMMCSSALQNLGEVTFPGRRLDLRVSHGLDGVANAMLKTRRHPCRRYRRRITREIIRLAPPRPNVRTAQAGIGTGPISFGTL